MSTAILRVERVGPQVTIQDEGRSGQMRFGVTRSGPMDRFALTAANLALANRQAVPAIEVSVGGLALTCTSGDIGIAIAGGCFALTLDGRPLPSWTTAMLRAGQSLQIRPGLWGNWCYLALAGEPVCQRWLGSAATHGPLGLGGGALVAGQVITVEQARPLPADQAPIVFPAVARPRRECRFVRGPQDRFFDADTIARFAAEAFVLSDAYDRMGVRLNGPSLTPSADLSMPSEPIVRGAVQVAGDGKATVLLADHQTSGGYPKIATVLDCDLDRFAQLRSRQQVRFAEVSPVQAIGVARTVARAREQALRRIAAGSPGISPRAR